MLFSILLKLLFACWLLFVILPRFARKRKLPVLLAELLLSLLLFMAFEHAINYFMRGSEHSHDHFGRFWLHLVVYTVILSICLAWFFTKEWVAHEKMKRQLIESQLSTELNFLKSQINPHFLFNTLNNLFSMAQQSGNEQVANGVFKLSGLMRYMIYDSSADKVPLEKEIAYIKDFIGLSKLRFTEEEVKLNFTIHGNVRDAFIMPMILIPFVENAFKHGVKIEKPSTIDISLSVAAGTVIFECTNAVYDITRAANDHGGIGLENVKRRLDLIYPGKYKLDIVNDGKTYKVILT